MAPAGGDGWGVGVGVGLWQPIEPANKNKTSEKVARGFLRYMRGSFELRYELARITAGLYHTLSDFGIVTRTNGVP